MTNRHLSRLGLFILLTTVVLGTTVLVTATALASSPAAPGPGPGAIDQSAPPTTNQTTTQPSAHQHASRASAVAFANQTINGTTVTIQLVTLSQPGYVTLHTSSYADRLVGPNESVIAVSNRLSAGTHHNVTIDISHAPPGNPPGLNQSQLNQTQTLVAVVYGETNGNHRLDAVRSFGEQDTLVTHNGDVVHDPARVRVPRSPQQTASVVFENQSLQKQNHTLTVAHARLPDGGFLVAQNASYRRTGDPVSSTVGVSRYLPPGNHTDVSLRVLSGAFNRTQVVTIRPSRDTNDNHRYDYIRSQGFRDVAYEDRTNNHSQVITDAGLVRVPPTAVRPSRTPARTRQQTSPSASSHSPGSATTVPRANTQGDGDGTGTGGFLGGNGFGMLLAGLLAGAAVLGGAFLVLRREG